MKVELLTIFLFLNLFCKLASAQWNDEVFLLQDPESHQVNPKIKKVRPKNYESKEKSKDVKSSEVIVTESPEARKPSQVDINSENDNLKKQGLIKNYVDLMAGFRRLNLASKFNYKDYYGETPTVGVKAVLQSGLWSWHLNYNTGFYYQAAKYKNLRLRDELAQIGFSKKYFSNNDEMYFGLSYFENQIVNENNNTAFIDNRSTGIFFTLEKRFQLDESMDIGSALSIAPWVSYKENITQTGIATGVSPSGAIETLKIGVSEKLDANSYLLLEGVLNWTQVQFKGSPSVADPISNESLNNVNINGEDYSFQIGIRWLN
jgi:hypothetical protein